MQQFSLFSITKTEYLQSWCKDRKPRPQFTFGHCTYRATNRFTVI